MHQAFIYKEQYPNTIALASAYIFDKAPVM